MTGPPRAMGAFGLRAPLGLLDLAAIGLVLLIPVATAPAVDLPFIAPKLALLVPLAAAGSVLLVGLAWRGEVAARVAVALLVWSALSALLSSAPRAALLGSYGVDRGVLTFAGYLGAWALGRRTSAAARPFLVGAVLVTTLINLVVGVAQVSLDLGDSWLAVVESRAAGLTPSSVYLGALCVGAAAVAARRLVEVRRRRSLILVGGSLVLIVMGANLTGSRIALAAIAVLLAAMILIHRPPWRRAVLLVGAALAGLVLSVALPSAGDASSTARATEQGSGGIEARVTMWDAGVRAWTEEPLTGWGPGRFQEATSPRVTAAFARAEGPDSPFFDAHDLFVENLTTGGIIGLALVVGFGWTAARRARGPLAWCAAGIAVTWLLEPMSVSVAPVALIALGAATPRPERPLPTPIRPVASVLAVVGVAVAVAMLWAGAQVKQAQDTVDLAAIDRALDVYRDEPALVDVRSQVLFLQHGDDPTSTSAEAVLRSTRRATELDPSNVRWWTRRGAAELLFADGATAQQSFRRGIERNPWSVRAWAGMRSSAELLGDDDQWRRADAKLCELESPLCDGGEPPDRPGG